MEIPGGGQMNARYLEQAKLLLDLIPFIASEKSVAIKGGTAINFFIRGLPRLSVDIDLVYLPLEPREKTLAEIAAVLDRISERTRRFRPDIKIGLKRTREGTATGLIANTAVAMVKTEINTVLRGSVYPVKTRGLDSAAQKALGYEGFLSVPVMSIPDLYGGKICAALDRQHPRDLFDIKVLFEHEGITAEIMKAFVVYCACHDRPMHELLSPKRQDIRPVFENEFAGMTDRPVTWEELEAARERCVSEIQNKLTDDEKNFLVSMKQGEPQWEMLGLPGIERLPALEWKLANVRKMDKAKRADMLDRLKKVLKM